jgi:hypothetical protein
VAVTTSCVFRLHFSSTYHLLWFQVVSFKRFLGAVFFVWWWFDIQTGVLDAVSYITTSVPNLAICHARAKRANMATCSEQYRWT